MIHNELQFVFLTKPVIESIKGARLCHRTEKEEEKKKTYTAEDPLDCVDQGRRGFAASRALTRRFISWPEWLANDACLIRGIAASQPLRLPLPGPCLSGESWQEDDGEEEEEKGRG